MSGYFRSQATYLAEVLGIEGPGPGAMKRWAETAAYDVDRLERQFGGLEEGRKLSMYELEARHAAIGEIRALIRAILDYVDPARHVVRVRTIFPTPTPRVVVTERLARAAANRRGGSR